jgi:uncharacterized membrane protein
MIGLLIVFFGMLIVVYSMVSSHHPKGSIRIGPFSGTGTVGFLIMILGVVTYFIENGLYSP